MYWQNKIGALWAGLLPSIIGIGVYFCIIDAVMLIQLFYYRYLYQPHLNTIVVGEPAEVAYPAESSDTDPLLPNEPPTQRPQKKPRRDSLTNAAVYKNRGSEVFKNLISVCLVLFAGSLGWMIAWKSGAWSPISGSPIESPPPIGASVLGYSSSILYLT